MIKFKTIQTKIKLLYLRLFRKIKKVEDHIEIKSKNNKIIKKILIIFPIKESAFRVALYSFRNLFRPETVSYIFLVNNIYKHHFHLPGDVVDLFVDERKNKVKFDETFLKDANIKEEFDMIIDLNNEFIFDICYMLNDLKSYYKIGFNHKYSDYFYNIQLEADILENSYKKIQQMIN